MSANMRISAIASAGLLACRLAAQGTGPVPEWEAILPSLAGGTGRVEFIGALEAGDGDLIVAGRDAGAELIARLGPDGRVRWVGRYPFAGGFASAFIGLHETSRGTVSLWGCCGQAGWTAMRHDDTGGLAARADLGFARGMLDVTPSARVVLLSSGSGGSRRFPIFAEGRGLAGQADWKTPLAEAAMDEVIGIRAVGDSSVAVLDRMGGPAGDTLMVSLLDAEGRVLWSRDVPTGAKEPGYPDNHSVIWSAAARGPDGRIVVAGIVEDFSAEDLEPDSLAVAVFSSGGNQLRLGRVPLRPAGDPVERGFWELLSLSVEDGGILVDLFHQAGLRFWSRVEIPWTGEAASFRSRSPANVGAVFIRASASASGAYLGFGAEPVSGVITPPAQLDTVWRPTAIVVPSLFHPVGGPDGEWRPRALPQYADTVRGRISPSPMGPGPEFSVAPGLDFLLFTRDGGALAGGRLWRRDNRDTLAVIAIKIPASGVPILQPREPGPGRRAIRAGRAKAGVDAAGRLGGNPRGPRYFRPGTAP